LALSNADLVGRLSLLAQGLVGVDGAWRGAGLAGAWRGTRPQIGASLFLARQTPSWSGHALVPRGLFDVEMRGAAARVDYDHSFDMAQLRAGVGASLAHMERVGRPDGAGERRQLAFAELGIAARQTGDGPSITESISVHGSVGRSGAPTAGFARAVVTAGVRTSGRVLLPLELGGSYGRVSEQADSYEYFLVGGTPSALIERSVLSQRLTMPALPTGVAIGRRVVTYRAAMPLGVFTPFYWGASATLSDGRFARWHRVAGVEVTFDMPAVAVAGTPGGHLVAGVARSVDAPFAHRTQAYLSVVLRP
jgi:hypothetical protein